MLPLLALACRPSDTPGPSAPVFPAFDGPEDPGVGPVRLWTAALPAPAEVVLRVTGGGETWTLRSPEALEHRIPLIGLLPDTDYQVAATAEGAWFPEVGFRTESPPDTVLWPVLDPIVWEPDLAEPGWTLFPLDSAGVQEGLVLVVDEELRPRWWWWNRETHVYNAELDGDDGLWTWIGLRAAMRLSFAGERRVRYDVFPEGDALPLPSGAVDHEILQDGEGGFWTFGHEPVPGTVPVDYGSHETREATVRDTPFTHVRADATIAGRFPLARLLDPARSGYDALRNTADGEVDFVHANAGQPLDDGGAMISVQRHDVILRLDADGEIVWMLGDPSGWSEPWASLLLRPVGEVVWPYHQHGLEWHPDRSLLLLFDNHIPDRTPYGPPSGPGMPSRGVGFEIDEEARTVRQVWASTETTTGPLRSDTLGEVDELPITGHRLIVYGSIADEDPSLGLGERTARLVEVDPSNGAIALDLRIGAPADTTPNGVWAYRAIRGLPPLRPR
ncbi:MAG: aryl-sulfate sulfotransferase [Alphaproteobacteria bacterium]|nr:aryl-sulfate sulfotransferase [Alphaproteobacteria bacterium]MCB9698049.1 aryl-sulfate sulfotransferase [Alphaproteobacteria bacterium]